MAKGISKEVVEHLGVITSTVRGRREGDEWQKEVNIVSWNESVPKVDIRDWDEDHDRCSKGITLSIDEAREVMEILTAYFSKEDGGQDDI